MRTKMTPLGIGPRAVALAAHLFTPLRLGLSVVTAGLALSGVAAVSVLTGPAAAQEKTSPPEFHLTAVGDAIIVTSPTVRQSDPRFMGVVNAIRKGDAALINFEGTFATRDAYPVYDTGGTWIVSNPDNLKGLQWMGFNLFAASNNHSVDFGVRGVLDTLKVFKENNAVFAGIGENLGEAQAPGYLSTPHGRVAFVAGASTFSAEAPAGQARPDMRGRPGLAPLRHQTVHRVNAATFEAVRKLGQELQLGGGQGGSPVRLSFDGAGAVTFEQSDTPGVVTTPDPRDLAALTHSIQNGKGLANYVVAYAHMHESAPGSIEVPAKFQVDYAHAAVDAGADVFVATGPHVLRGIEIYRGKVILYSLGNFIFENDLVVPQPSDLYQTFGLGPDALPAELFDARSDHDRRNWPAEPKDWESVVADVMFRDGHPVGVTLTPVSLGFGEKRPDRGYPKLADPALATKLLERLQKLSQPFGTTIAIKNGVGTITISPMPATSGN